jgi:two-component system, response regulator YesN
MADPKSILLIDGSARDRRYYGSVVQGALPDCRILEAENGEDGLKLYQSQSIDCVILELALPDIHGTDLLKQLYVPGCLARKPVIVLTRLFYPTILTIARENGAIATFVKKVTSEQVLQDAVLAALSIIPASLSAEKG